MSTSQTRADPAAGESLAQRPLARAGGGLDALAARVRKSASERITRNTPLAPRLSRLGAPVASFSFDDFPKSALHVGGAILEAAGGRATYFVAGGLEGREIDGHVHFDRDDLRAAHARGHEIGCHTFDHIRMVFETRSAIEASLARNAAFVRDALGGAAMTSFAYPFGHVNLATKLMTSRRFPVARGIHPGVNAGVVDMAQLRAVALEQITLEDVDRLIATARRRKGWLVFFGHDVAESPSFFGCTPAHLEAVVGRVKAAGIEILPIRAAAERVVRG